MLSLLLLFWSRDCRADAVTVALVRPDGGDARVAETATRIHAELVAAGFDVDDLVSDGSEPERQVEAAKLSPAPVATLAVSNADGVAVADIWFTDRSTHEIVMRHVDVTDVPVKRAPSVLAVRVVELLRASLLAPAAREATKTDTSKPAEPKPAETTPAEPKPLPVKPPVATPKPAVEKKAPDLAPPEPEHDTRPEEHGSRGSEAWAFRGELGAAVVYGARGVSPAFAPVLRLGLGTGTWGGRLSVVAPAFGGEVSAAGGTATVREEMLSLDVTGTWPSEGRLALLGFAGGGGYHWYINGAGSGANVGHASDRWGALAQAGLGGVLRFGARSGLLLDAAAVFMAPPLVVQIAGVNAGRSGQPTLCASLGFWVAL